MHSNQSPRHLSNLHPQFVCQSVAMELERATPFSLVVPNSACPELIGYHKHGATLGSALQFEWRHWHYALHSTDLREWMSKQGPSVLDCVRRKCNLGAADIMRAPPRPVPLGICPRMTCSTKAAVCGLLAHAADVRSNHPARRLHLWGLCNAWSRFATLGLARPELGEVRLVVPLPDRDVTVIVEKSSGSLVGFGPISEEHPHLQQLWDAKSSSSGGFSSSWASPSLVDAFFFSISAPSSVVSRHPWLTQFAHNLVETAAVCIEAFVWFDYLPSKGRLQSIHGLKGSQRSRNIDPISREMLGHKMETIGGSSSTVAKAAAGKGWYATAWRHATVLKYNELSKKAFFGVERLSLAIDPGSYSGESTMVGVAYDTSSGISAILPTKAGVGVGALTLIGNHLGNPADEKL